MLYKSYTRTEQFTHLFRKLEYYQTLELIPRYRHVFERKTKFFACYIVGLVNVSTYGLYLFMVPLTFLNILFWPTPTMLVSAIVWMVLNDLLIRGLAAVLLTCFFYVYITTLYLSLRYRQINENLLRIADQSKCLLEPKNK